MIEETRSLGRVEVRPQPSPEELAAIGAVLRARKARHDEAGPAPMPAWVEAGRREAMRAREVGPVPGGWARAARLGTLR